MRLAVTVIVLLALSPIGLTATIYVPDDYPTIQGAIDELPDKYKEALILRDVEGMSYQQIAEITKVPIGTVKSRVNRARLRLQKKLKGHAPEDELIQ